MTTPFVRHTTLLFAGGMLLLSSGCSSVMTRVGPHQGYYAGTKNDLQMIGSEESGWAMRPLLALDLPLSAVADTLLLPYDYYRADDDPATASPRARVQRAEQASAASGMAPPAALEN
ncbi:YceK/YidQ family lipoprotein [Edwardsiella piscicida]|nr:YceK/YidQ family lipoprotein [Edwardsiella piscicida]AGH72140.1 Outer membrane lipoprotein YidQ [Edwardsiella piscicida C07-087]AOP44685.2 YceK/YidQ family lipoprotein [Edwardsiella piscicida]ARD18270.1 YceK/YidQ family lipoprotein [Edwardsiella piscicida]EKS7767558.1 YceK/YidQ family lipoprotein [Edwardsiella piscicida]EKS7781070.1 YceK/YidQ family lipoprotein [Edwardsiella piscicida]